MNRLTRTLTFINSSDSKQFHSFIGDSRLRFSTVKSLAVPLSVINLRHESFSITSNLKSFSAVPDRLTPAGMDFWDRHEAPGFEEFVRVHGGGATSNLKGSNESVVEEREPDEVNEESQSRSYERKVFPEELSRNVLHSPVNLLLREVFAMYILLEPLTFLRNPAKKSSLYATKIHARVFC